MTDPTRDITPPLADPQTQPDLQAAEEQMGYKAASQEKAKLQNRQLEQDLGERKKYTLWIFLMVVSWVVTMFLIIFLQGFGIFQLDTKLVMVLIGSTTVTMLGIFAGVTRYLFPSKASKRPRKENKSPS